MSSEAAQPAPSARPGVISYAGPSPAARRVLDLDLRRSAIVRAQQPTVAIDGQRYVCDWGPCRFEIPADRAVHVSVHIDYRHQVGAASLTLDPADAAELDYSAPAVLSKPGSLGPRGTTSAQGRGTRGVLLAGLGITVLLGAVFVLAIVLTVV